MAWILTLPEWETKAPACYRRRGESYWKAVELPLDSESVFIVNTLEDRPTRTPARSMTVVTTAQLLDLLERIGSAFISSAYLIRRSLEEGGDELMIHRLTVIRAGDAEQLGWNRIIAIDAEDGFSFTDQDPDGRVQRWANEVEVFRFPSANQE